MDNFDIFESNNFKLSHKWYLLANSFLNNPILFELLMWNGLELNALEFSQGRCLHRKQVSNKKKIKMETKSLIVRKEENGNT